MPGTVKTKSVRIYLSVMVACLTTFALGIDMSISLPYDLILTLRDGFWGRIDNLLIALNYFHTMDHLIGTVLVAALIYVYARWLWVSEDRYGWGEYALSGFFALTMLMSEVIAAENSIKALWAGGTQLIKAMIYLLGMWPLFLAGIRILQEGLQKIDIMQPVTEKALWNHHPFMYPFLLMALCWLPYMVMKYPGGMSPDVTVQILDWQNQTMELSHPPLPTVIYGLFYDFGIRIGNTNIGFFLFTLLQTICFLCVLSFSCARMRAWNVPKGIYIFVLFSYCIIPNYSGWTTTLVKDVPYVISCILFCILLIDFSLDVKAFCKNPVNDLLIIIAGTTVWLWRRNGILMALACIVCMLIMAYRQAAFKCMGKLTILGVLVTILSLGTNAVLTSVFSFSSAAKRETYSHLLQVTGRVAVEFSDAYTEEEISIINQVMNYEEIPKWYSPIITDGMKALFKEKAKEEEYAAFRKLVARKLISYPVEYIDAYANLIYRLFDWRSDRGDFIARREISHPYYIRSYTNLLYNQEELQSLNAAQEAVENLDYWFPDLPFVGLLVNVGACVDIMLAMCWIMVHQKRKRAIAALAPALLTMVFCLFSPVVYIRYALPITSTLPLWFAAYTAHGKFKQEV